MLSAPLVVGGSVLGDGSLEMIGDTITSTAASFDRAPPELSLRLFTVVPNSGGGFSAILRFRIPVVVLHSWRGHPVRQTMTVVVTSPSGASQAVQMQPDGTVMSGAWVSGRFSPSAPGQAVIAGNVVVFGIPASFGAAADWTVQAIVRVQADAPLHPNRPATGYAAGTSVVPIGMLTATNGGSARWGVADAITALTSTSTGSSGVLGLRPTAVRIEGAGTARTAVVTLDGSPLQVSPSAYPHLNLDLAPPRFATLDHPFRVTWLPNGAQPVTSAQVSLDSVVIGDVPVSVSGAVVRFGLGSFVLRGSVAKRPTPALDTIRYSVTIPVGSDEVVHSTDGISGPASSAINAEIEFDRGRVTITPAGGSVAKGRVDSAGYFTAFNATDCYTGGVDQFGNVVIYRTSIAAAPAAARQPGPSVYLTQYALGPDGDLTIADPGPIYPTTAVDTHYKETNAKFERPPSPTPDWDGRMPPTPNPDDEDADFVSSHGGPAQPGGAQGGNPDWPNSPTTGSGTASGSSAFAVRVTGGITPRGQPSDVTTPWVLPATLAGASTSSPLGLGGTLASPTGGGVSPLIAVVAVVAIVAASAVVVTRRRRRPPVR